MAKAGQQALIRKSVSVRRATATGRTTTMWATASPAELRTLSEPIGNPIWLVGVCPDGFRLLSLNSACEAGTGLSYGRVGGKRLEQFLPPAVLDKVLSRCRDCLQQRCSIEFEERVLRGGARRRWRTVLTPLMAADGRVVRLLGSSVDITAHRALEAELRQTAQQLSESKLRLQLALRGGEVSIWDWDIAGRRLHIHDDVSTGGGTAGELSTLSVREWLHSIHSADRARALSAGDLAARGEADDYRVEYRHRARDGRWIWLEVHGRVMERGPDGAPRRVCGTYRDISRQMRDQVKLQKLTARLLYRARHDSLTGLLNHGAVLEALEAELARQRRDGGELLVALLDVDYFKAVNDTYGHRVGDEVLQALAARIGRLLRPYDHFGRYGGEEFLIVAPLGDGSGGLGERICRAVAEAPFETAAGPLELTVSVGESVGGGPVGGEELLLAADAALYRAKGQGRNQVVRESGPVSVNGAACELPGE